MAALRVSMFLLAFVLLTTCYSASVPNYDPRLTEDMVAPKKRPFCNTFAGCGRKRSLYPPGMPLQDMMRSGPFEDDMGYDSDNAIEDLSRQILSEAKLWEAIQDASAQIVRRKQKEALM